MRSSSRLPLPLHVATNTITQLITLTRLDEQYKVAQLCNFLQSCHFEIPKFQIFTSTLLSHSHCMFVLQTISVLFEEYGRMLSGATRIRKWIFLVAYQWPQSLIKILQPISV